MIEYLSKWYFWVIIVIILLIVIWVLSRKNNSKSEKTKSRSITDTVSECSRKSRKRKTTKKVMSSYDAIPEYETLPDIASEEECDHEIDLTPDIDPQILYSEFESKKQSKGEAECKRVIEHIYGVPFQTQIRPKWLVNPSTGRCLELDLYNENLKLAVEYNGEQHYKYKPYFHKSFKDFKAQVMRDNIKIDLCDELGIYLITVPYNVPVEKIETYIRYYLPDAVAARENRFK